MNKWTALAVCAVAVVAVGIFTWLHFHDSESREDRCRANGGIVDSSGTLIVCKKGGVTLDAWLP